MKKKLSLDRQKTILNISEMVLLIMIMNDMRIAYSKKHDTFYHREPMFITISFQKIIPDVKLHCRRSGISSRLVDRWFRTSKNIFDLLSNLRKATMFLNVTLEEMENYTIILGYNEYKRGRIKFFRITTIDGALYNTEKYKQIGRNIKLRIKSILYEERTDRQTLKQELNNDNRKFKPYNPYQ